MGLDVVAYQGLTILDHPLQENCWDEHIVLPIHTYISEWNHTEGFPDQDYVCCKTTVDSFHFRAGSYSGYGDWRRWLAHMALQITPEEVWERGFSPQLAALPFTHLIYFSDCEGVIGRVVARKLALDFMQYRAQALQASHAENDPYGHYLQVYDDFSRAFHMAADDGAVVFC